MILRSGTLSRQMKPCRKFYVPIMMLLPMSACQISQATAQQAETAEFTLSKAIEQAVELNASYRTAQLETKRAVNDLAAFRTKRYLSTAISAQGAGLLTEPKIQFPAGSFGSFPSTGPIPANDQTITIPRDIVGIVSATASQPLTNLYSLNLQTKNRSVGLEGTREDERKEKLSIIDKTRRAYYEVVQAQSSLDSLKDSLPYYRESQRIAQSKWQQETTLQSDVLSANAQLLKAETSISDAEDDLSASTEKLNDLMGRDIHTRFRVSGTDFMDLPAESREALEARALQNRPDARKARLDITKADLDTKAKRAEYIPEISASASYYTTFNFGSTLPSNIAYAGLALSWEP